MERQNELKKYLGGSYAWLIFTAIFILLGIFVGIALESFGGFAFLSVVGLLFCIGPIVHIVGMNRCIQQYTENGMIDQALEEFQNGLRLADDNIRLGNRYVFGKNSGVILGYQEIVKVYQYIHKTNFVEDLRELRVETRDRKTISLCKLKLRGKSDNVAVGIVGLLLSRNPQIKIGYR